MKAPARTKESSQKKRVRRSPEDAQTLLLDAAERVFKKKLPDSVGLKEVAREAGVSHSLVSHYFGTYDALVEATLERRVLRLREHLVAVALSSFGDKGRAVDLLSEYRRAVEELAKDPVTMRLAVWALLSGRANAADFFPSHNHGMKALADLIVARAEPKVSREHVEFSLIASFAMTITWVFGKRALLAAMGRKHTVEEDAWFDFELRHMIDRYVK